MLNNKGGLFASNIFKFFPKTPDLEFLETIRSFPNFFPKKNSRPSAENVEQQGELFAKGGIC